MKTGSRLLLSSCCWMAAVVRVSNAALDCSFQSTVEIDDGLFLNQIANYQDNTYTMQLTYTGGEAWIGIGINTEGKNKMAPADAVIGRLEDDGSTLSVLDYVMTSDAEDASGVQIASAQTVTNARFIQVDDTSTLLFTKPLDGITEDSRWVYGVGLPDNEWTGKHKITGSFRFEFTSCLEVPDTPSPTKTPTKRPTLAPTGSPVLFPPTVSPQPTISPAPSSSPSRTPLPSAAPQSTETEVVFPEGGFTPGGGSNVGPSSSANSNSQFEFFDTTHPYRKVWSAHGVLMVLAWGVLAPIGIGASILRQLIKSYFTTTGLWYTIHFYALAMSVVLTMIGFLLAVVATGKEGKAHFDDTHHRVGLTIFVLVLVQAVAGYLRPSPATTTTTTKQDDTNESDSNNNIKNDNDDDDDDNKMFGILEELSNSEVVEGDDHMNTSIEVGAALDSPFGKEPEKTTSEQSKKSNKKKSIVDDIPAPSDMDDGHSIEVGATFDSSFASDNGSNTQTAAGKARLAWEYSHRLLGMILLALAWYNCHSGIEWHVSNYPDDQNDYTGAFWGVTGGISGLVFLLAYVMRIV